MTHLSLRLARFALGAWMCVLAAAPAWAQANVSDEVTQSRGASGSQAGGDGVARLTHVGAGTNNGTTTGYSGPKSPPTVPPGQTRVPPLPQAALCDAYQGSAAHQPCLQTVLRASAKGDRP
ncbi:hypothetical protein [Aquabacter spiritensis]|uniref:Uncharacterized protein n=1 Tax=Aquabacter spiritensis TaxID=933073 RepID=A0A4R3LN68_9HYPH|nr:hypothetical protein [Aquabacter spiritensis]TCT01561.1 hypothetical protein EDC64_11860 [Aquabacter spiritensis]